MDVLEKVLRHPDPSIRREVLRQLTTLRPSGSGAKLVGLLGDPDEAVRLTAMKLLGSGHYQAAGATGAAVRHGGGVPGSLFAEARFFLP
ncbi:MAG: HEAT repeat domain-containing protein [Nitrospiraceae bacterium]